MMHVDFLLLVVGIALLVKGADWFVRGSSDVAYFFKISPFVVGLTIVAFGTSAPEAAVSMIAALRGQAELSYGNIVGSSMANLLLVLGLSAILTPIAIRTRIIKKEFPFAIFIVLMVLLFTIIGAEYLNRIEGFLLLVIFAVFMTMLFKSIRTEKKEATPIRAVPAVKRSIVILILGLSGIVIGGNLTTTHASNIAVELGMSERLVGLSIVAVGTSLPEVATIIASWLKKENDIAIGNIIGSNIFNLAFVLGISASLEPIALSRIMRIDMVMLLVVTLIAYWFAITGKILTKLEGSLLVILYVAYLTFVIIRN